MTTPKTTTTKNDGGLSPEALRQVALSEAEGWMPKTGDALTGKVARISVNRNGQYDPYPVVTLETAAGQFIAVHCFHALLKNRVRELRPALGAELKITYIGTVPSKKTDAAGNPLNDSNVYVVEGVEKPFDWNNAQF